MAADAMQPEEILYTLLKSVSGIPLAPFFAPVFHSVMPDGQSPPCISFVRIATRYDHTLTGRSQFTKVIFQVDIWGRTESEVGQISTNIHTGLDGLKQGVAEGQALFIMPMNEISLFEEEEKTHRRVITFEVTIREYSS